MSLAETATATDSAAVAKASQKPANFPTKPLSTQMRSVITIFAADLALYDLVSPFINLAEESINWKRISALLLCQGHRAVCDWAYICWRDEAPEGSNPFDGVLNADVKFRKAIAKALTIRWDVAR